MLNFVQDIKKFDASFHKWKMKNAGSNFSDFSASRILNGLKKGRPHASLGKKIAGETDWWNSGLSSFKNICNHWHIRPEERILEYGCGSLRVGAHFIKKQSKNCYYGLDICSEFIRYGEEILGNIVDDKKVQLGTIKQNMTTAIAFAPDYIFSANVIMHIHPDEIELAFNNFKDLGHSNLSVVTCHVLVSDSPTRLKRETWSWPMSYYDKIMRPFVRIATTELKQFTINGHDSMGYLISYQKPIK